MQAKTSKEVTILQNKAQKLADKLNEEIVTITRDTQHIQVQIGTVYQLNIEDFDAKKLNLIAKKVGDDLEVTLEEGAVIFDNYFAVCATDLSCLVSLPAENGELYHVIADTFFTLEDGTQVVYFYGEHSIVSTESSATSADNNQSFMDVVNSNIAIVAAVVVAAVVVASSGSGNSDGDSDSDGNSNFFVTLMAGPVFDNTGIKIAAYDKDGKLIAEGEKQTDGRYKFDKSKITGIVIFKAYDTDDAVDYQDEKGDKMDLDIALLAVTNTEGKSVAAITVLTTIAAKQAGITDDGKAEAGGVTVSSTPLTETIVNAKNEGVGKAFGVNDIISIPKAIIDKNGKVTQDADNYGQVLAMVSGVGTIKDVVEKYDTMGEWDTATQNDGTFKDAVKQEFVNGAAKVVMNNDEINDIILNTVLTGNGSITAQVFITITSNKTGIAGNEVTFTFTFSNALANLSDFTVSDIGITGGTAASSFKTGATTTVYQLVVTPNANTEGNIIISVDAKLSKYTSAINFTQAYDVKAPTTPENLVLATNDDTGLSDSDNITNKTTVTITGKAEAGSMVELFNGNTSLGEKITADSNGNFSKTVTLAANATTNITAKATDAIGNTSVASSALLVSVDTTDPTFTSGNTGASVVNQINPVYNAEVDDGDTSVKYTLRTADLLKFNINADSGIVTYKTAPSAITATLDNIVITATDIAGNSQTHNVAIAIVNNPLVIITSNKPNGTNGAFELTFTFTEKVNGFELSDIVFTGAGTNDANISKGALTTASSGANQNKVFTLMVTPETALTDGDITVDVAANVATSATSNQANIVAAQLIQKFDETKPATPNAILTDSGSNTTDGITNDATISVPANTETNATVEYKINEGAWHQIYTKPTTGGTYTVKVRQTDRAGNVSDEQSIVFTLDTTVPIVNTTTITATNATGTAKTDVLGVGDKVIVTVTLSEIVVVTGTPTYTINVGGVNKAAIYSSSFGDTLVFSYAIVAGDNDSAGGITAGVNALLLAGSTLKDKAGHDAVLTTPAVTDNGSKAQWATGASASSQSNSANYGANEAIGAPDSSLNLDDNEAQVGNSWSENWDDRSKINTLTLTYDTAVFIQKIVVRETYKTGAIKTVEVFKDGNFETVYTKSGATETGGKMEGVVAGKVSDTEIILDNILSYKSEKIRISVGSDGVSESNLIDAVQLIGLMGLAVDTTAPILFSAIINDKTLVLTYDEFLDATHVPILEDFALNVNGSVIENAFEGNIVINAKTITLTLTNAIAIGASSILLNYVDSTGNDTNTIRDTAGNRAARITGQSVENNIVADTTAPIFTSAAVDDTTLVLTYNEVLDAGNIPATSAFTLEVDGNTVVDAFTGVAVVDAMAKTVTLTLASAVINGATVRISYIDTTTGDDTSAIQDTAGNDAASISNKNVVNNTPFAVDLDPATGIQISSSVASSATKIAIGVAFDADIADATSAVIKSIKVILGGTGLNTTHDKLVLDNDIALNNDITKVTGKTIGTVTGLEYTYTKTSQTLLISKTTDTFTAIEVAKVVEAIKLKNIDADSQLGIRTATITYTDTAGNESNSAIASLEVAAPRGFILNGEMANDQSSYSLSSAGDVNGDGLDDLIIGTPNATPDGRINAGKSYVVFGKTTGAAIDLSAITSGTGGFVINGETGRTPGGFDDDSDHSGFSVSSAGDMNGDGLDDLIVVADNLYDFEKKPYVIFGTTSTTAINLSTIANSTKGFTIVSDSVNDSGQMVVSSTGDVNGDGLDDLIIGIQSADPDNRSRAGKSYVVFGKTTGTVVDLNIIASGTGGFVINGEVANDRSGSSVSNAGDVNGDGLDDLIIGANYASDYKGKTYVVFGTTDTTAIELSAIASGTGGFVINGKAEKGYSGTSVSSAGDVNGDGLDDLLVGAHITDSNGKSNAGNSYVVFGTTNTTAIDLSAIASGTGGFVIKGESVDDRSGFSVSGAGDVNGDGLDDLLVGAYYANNQKGKTYVIFGTADTTAIDLSAIVSGTGGFVIHGETAGDESGASVSGAGDVNGDGLDDLLISGTYADPNGKSGAGKSYVVFGKTDTEAIDLTKLSGNSKYAIDYLGNENANTLTGTNSNEIFVADADNDILIGNGGMDVFNAGSGDDTIIINASNIAALAQMGAGNRSRVDGGGNTDTLKLDGSDLTLDLTNISNRRIQDIEVIDITGSGNNTLKLNLNDLLDSSSSTNILKVIGNSGDKVDITVDSTHFIKGTGITQGSIQYDVYAHSRADSDAHAALWVQQDVSII
ncbi:beta strand repeat-containing protein [Bathymodiolus thermophilus thioautotrophic gill symbiont]|uniref:Bacterial Ig-like domain-containing protein n=1 Tax=Bathymodiolus thermophilus thioautotrophic gill symbiont TaxID=2360 RepID=A0A8H8XDF2_9GAMM|nr:SwmB domain-containing protein [Bathymodiolus thermophilus thioautotrophic gill symbiont]CAB5498340.1 hypothetical protein THERMOS_828 [Bathymodiolus thermophilus thioautotrophic gill symbiont]